MVEFTERDILLHLSSFEDNLVERKVLSDLGDCLKTAVAFANIAPIGVPAILFVGVRNNGEIEGIENPDKVQQTVSAKIARAYPQIFSFTRLFSKDGKRFLAVIIPGSENRPHFAGRRMCARDRRLSLHRGDSSTGRSGTEIARHTKFSNGRERLSL